MTPANKELVTKLEAQRAAILDASKGKATLMPIDWQIYHAIIAALSSGVIDSSKTTSDKLAEGDLCPKCKMTKLAKLPSAGIGARPPFVLGCAFCGYRNINGKESEWVKPKAEVAKIVKARVKARIGTGDISELDEWQKGAVEMAEWVVSQFDEVEKIAEGSTASLSSDLVALVDKQIDWTFKTCDRRTTINLDDILKLRIHAALEAKRSDSEAGLRRVVRAIQALSTKYPSGNMKFSDVFKSEVLQILRNEGTQP